MARVTGPLFSLEARGSIAKAVTYRKWMGRVFTAARWKKSKYTRSSTQDSQRTIFLAAVDSWKGRPDVDKARWLYLGKRKARPITGICYYTRKYILINRGLPQDEWQDIPVPPA